jgi:hypothetical protein
MAWALNREPTISVDFRLLNESILRNDDRIDARGNAIKIVRAVRVAGCSQRYRASQRHGSIRDRRSSWRRYCPLETARCAARRRGRRGCNKKNQNLNEKALHVNLLS